MVNLPGTGGRAGRRGPATWSAGLPPSGTECPPRGLSGTECKHLVLPAAPSLAFTRTGTREGGLWRMEMVSPKPGAGVSASVCGGTWGRRGVCPLAGAGGELRFDLGTWGALLLALPLQGWQSALGVERKEIYIKYVNMLLLYMCVLVFSTILIFLRGLGLIGTQSRKS